MVSKIPDCCTICGDNFRKKKSGIYPYPEKEWLCSDCFKIALDEGLNRLNKVLRGEKLTSEDYQTSLPRSSEGRA